MKQMDIKNKLKILLSEIIKVDQSKITNKTSPDNVNNWDSLSHIQLTMEIEHVFGINLTTEEIIKLDSFSKACKIVSEKLRKKNND